MIVLDTNVISEAMRLTPSPAAASWLAKQHAADLFTTAVTEAEIRLGVAMLPLGRRRQDLEAAAQRVLGLFSGRILPFDSAASQDFSDIVATRRNIGPANRRFRRSNRGDCAVPEYVPCHAQHFRFLQRWR